jgi:hypothetical protein
MTCTEPLETDTELLSVKLVQKSFSTVSYKSQPDFSSYL